MEEKNKCDGEKRVEKEGEKGGREVQEYMYELGDRTP